MRGKQQQLVLPSHASLLLLLSQREAGGGKARTHSEGPRCREARLLPKEIGKGALVSCPQQQQPPSGNAPRCTFARALPPLPVQFAHARTPSPWITPGRVLRGRAALEWLVGCCRYRGPLCLAASGNLSCAIPGVLISRRRRLLSVVAASARGSHPVGREAQNGSR
ncbi:hypothetical protein MTO96_041091 [Rhipicephalus appendiculatus]